MIKVCLNGSLERAYIESIFFGEAVFQQKIQNIGELHVLKDNYENLWIHPSLMIAGDKKRLMVEVDEPSQLLERRNDTIKGTIGRCLPSRFLFWADFSENNFEAKVGKISTQLNKEELFKYLKGETLYDFACSCLIEFLEKRIDD